MANVLVIGPHPDDQELGMGGTIARLAADGHSVWLLDMTDGEPTPLGDPATRAAEAASAAEVLSAPGSPVRRVLLDLPNRTVAHTIEARHKVAAVIRAVQADVMFVPYFEDAHPDHRAVTLIAEDARFDAKLGKLELAAPPAPRGPAGHAADAWSVGPPIYPRWLFHYYCTHLRIVPSPSFIIDTSGFELRKRDAILAYRSQFVLPEKNRRVVEWLHAAGTYFGSRIGATSGEPFFSREPVGLAGLGGVLGL